MMLFTLSAFVGCTLVVTLVQANVPPDCPDGYVIHGDMCKTCEVSHVHAIGTPDHTQCVCDADYYNNPPPSRRRRKRQPLPNWPTLYCTPCPPGYSTGGVIGAESVDECNECADGYVIHDGMCKTCEVSHVHAIGTPDHTQCVCDVNYYNNPPPSRRRRKRQLGNWPPLYCTPCPQGYSTGGAIGAESEDECNECADGYVIHDGMCKSCDFSHEYATSTPDHLSCVCDVDYYNNPPLERRRKKRQLGNWSPLYCTECPDNSDTDGQIGATECLCDAGFYMKSGNDEGSSSESSSQSSSETGGSSSGSSDRCQRCPPGQTSPKGSTEPTDCVPE